LGQLSPDRSSTDEKWREVAMALAHIECLMADQKAALPADARDAIKGSEASLKKRSLAAIFGAWTRKNHAMDVTIPAELAGRFKRGTRELFEPQSDGSFLVPGLAYQTVAASDIPGVVVGGEREERLRDGLCVLATSVSQLFRVLSSLCTPPHIRRSRNLCLATTCCGTRCAVGEGGS
jgi:hypothetical protein